MLEYFIRANSKRTLKKERIREAKKSTSTFTRTTDIDTKV